MHFYQNVTNQDYEGIVDYLSTRASQNGVNPEATTDILILWEDEEDEDGQPQEPTRGRLYVSKQLLDLV